MKIRVPSGLEEFVRNSLKHITETDWSMDFAGDSFVLTSKQEPTDAQKEGIITHFANWHIEVSIIE